MAIPGRHGSCRAMGRTRKRRDGPVSRIGRMKKFEGKFVRIRLRKQKFLKYAVRHFGLHSISKPELVLPSPAIRRMSHGTSHSLASAPKPPSSLTTSASHSAEK